MANPESNLETSFALTDEWQEVPAGVALPETAIIRLDKRTGKAEARRPGKPIVEEQPQKEKFITPDKPITPEELDEKTTGMNLLPEELMTRKQKKEKEKSQKVSKAREAVIQEIKKEEEKVPEKKKAEEQIKPEVGGGMNPPREEEKKEKEAVLTLEEKEIMISNARDFWQELKQGAEKLSVWEKYNEAVRLNLLEAETELLLEELLAEYGIKKDEKTVKELLAEVKKGII